MVNLPAVWLLFAVTVAQAQDAALAAISAAIDREEFASAARQAGAFVGSHPESVAGRVVLARAYLGLNKGAEALRELRAALHRDPDSLDALYYLTKLTSVLSQQEFAAVARLAPESARMHQINAEVFEVRGDSRGAEAEYLAALEKRPDSSSIMNALGDLKRREKMWNAALEWYQKVLAKDPDNYDALYGAGACRRAVQSTGDALVLFRRALESDPSSTAAKLAVGEALLLTGTPGDAVPLLEEAAKADPRLRRLQFLLARAYRAVGRNEDARRAFARAHELPEEPGEPGDDR